MLPNLSACSVSTGSAGSNLNSRNVDAVDLAVPDRDFTDQKTSVDNEVGTHGTGRQRC